MTILPNKSLLIPELGYFGQTVAFQLVRTEWTKNFYLQKKGERDILVGQHPDLFKSKCFIN